MRDVNYGWLIRYLHANGASFFFIVVYLHIGRGLYFGSYRPPRLILWIVGVIIYIIMMATAFLGYVLPWGQMSFWGELFCPKWLDFEICYLFIPTVFLSTKAKDSPILPFNRPNTKSAYRIGPHCEDIYSIAFGSLLGDSYAELRDGATRLCFQQEIRYKEYLLWLHSLISNLGYCNPEVPEIKTRLDGDRLRYLFRLKTWSYISFTWIHNVFYSKVNDK